MAGNALDGVAVVVERETLGSQGDSLVELHVVADDAGGPDDYARAVVDGEMVADGSRRMDVDASLGMGHLGNDSWNQGHAELYQFVGYAVVGEGLDDGIARDDLAEVLSGGVAVVGCLHVGSQDATDLGEPRNKLGGYDGRCAVAFREVVADVTLATAEAESGHDLVGEQLAEPLHVDTYMILDGLGIDGGFPEIAGKKDGT